MIDFLRQRKIAEKLILIVGLLFFALVHIVGSYFITGKFLGFVQASDSIILSQKIEPFDPVEKTEPLAEISSENPEAGFSEFRIVAPIGEEPEVESNTLKDVSKSSIVTFYGLSLYPNSKVLLEVNSEKFFASVTSDEKGKWRWTNYGQPLEDGEHSIKMYNISPFEISGKRDIFVQQYAFDVKASANRTNPDNVTIPEAAYKNKIEDGDLEKNLIEGNAKNVYIMEVELLNEKEYNPGDSINVNLSFYSLGKNSPENTKINYALYSYTDDPSKAELAYQSEDNVLITGDNFFSKKINIKDTIFSSNYILKVSAKIGENEYVQAKKLKIVTKPVIRIGSTIITEEKFSKMVLFDITAVIVMIILILITVILEFRRFLARKPVSECDLKGKGYF